MDSIEKVGKICRDILDLNPEDFKAIEALAQEQKDYMHPFKNGKASKLHKTGNHNQRTLVALQNLHKVLVEGDPKNG